MEKDGGSAFPEICTDTSIGGDGSRIYNTYSYGGMSLRDWFAGMALQGILGSTDEQIAEKSINSDVASEWAYEYADAMLARKQRSV